MEMKSKKLNLIENSPRKMQKEYFNGLRKKEESNGCRGRERNVETENVCHSVTHYSVQYNFMAGLAGLEINP